MLKPTTLSYQYSFVTKAYSLTKRHKKSLPLGMLPKREGLIFYTFIA